MTVDLAKLEAPSFRWNQRHLLGLEDLSRAEIETILDAAEEFAEFSQLPGQKRTELKGKTVVNLFFEPSTRTRTNPSNSESFVDTAKNIKAMGLDLMVMRRV